MACPVKYFVNTMQGAPQLTNTWGCMTALLDAVLVNGFNQKTLGSLTCTGGIATATIPAGHGYVVDQVLLIAGADQTEYNGEFRVLSVTSTAFTFAVSGTPVTPATGATITAKAAPLGWEILHTGTNKRAYRSKNVASNRPVLRVDDGLDPSYVTTYAKKGKVTMAQGMSDIDTFVGARAPFDPLVPTKNEIGTGSGTMSYDGCMKWYYARGMDGRADASAPTDAGPYSWVLVGDDRGFYMFNAADTALGNRAGAWFTDFESYKAGDGFNTFLLATEAYNRSDANPARWPMDYNECCRTNYPYGKYVMRDHLQIGSPVRMFLMSLNTQNTAMGSGYNTSVPWPNGPDYGMLLHPVYLQQETLKHYRGRLPGIMWVCNDMNNTVADLTKFDSVAGYPGRKFLLVAVDVGGSNYGRLALDITGPWW